MEETRWVVVVVSFWAGRRLGYLREDLAKLGQFGILSSNSGNNEKVTFFNGLDQCMSNRLSLLADKSMCK